ncbi:hypothetical protein [Bacillus sp. T33-2]|uniref:hypothetical protein n=1 Tax=Bacillus sp. T33-2 TaxID=2054168 RepID=UPI000C773055|nr:hypothetical protein [Bacillus sp. T33-2]PLR99616.1 hypothetical protein CVD19_00710 [Bacillus sp. T33-2]
MRTKIKQNIHTINNLKRIALDGKKSRLSLIGKKVMYIDQDTIKKQLITNEIYTIADISAGNYDVFIYLEELPKERYSEYSRRIVPNSYNIEEFELV